MSNPDRDPELENNVSLGQLFDKVLGLDLCTTVAVSHASPKGSGGMRLITVRKYVGHISTYYFITITEDGEFVDNSKGWRYRWTRGDADSILRMMTEEIKHITGEV